jgi:hypothetical protein
VLQPLTRCDILLPRLLSAFCRLDRWNAASLSFINRDAIAKETPSPGAVRLRVRATNRRTKWLTSSLTRA